jgi:hypothetical protein
MPPFRPAGAAVAAGIGTGGRLPVIKPSTFFHVAVIEYL